LFKVIFSCGRDECYELLKIVRASRLGQSPLDVNAGDDLQPLLPKCRISVEALTG
jgi:hypothetical protein